MLMNEKVTEYIKKCRALGMSDKQIEEKLVNSGWKLDQIKDAELSLKKEITPYSNILSTENSKKDIHHKTERKIPDNSYVCTVTDNIIPHRGVLWYIFFTFVFMGSSALIIFYTDWALLFVIIVVAGVLLWRGHQGTKMSLEITEKGIKVNNKKFSFDDINSFYISKIGDNATINIILIKKYLPKLTYIFFNDEDMLQIKKRIEEHVPTMGKRDESYIDLIIRRLKL